MAKKRRLSPTVPRPPANLPTLTPEQALALRAVLHLTRDGEGDPAHFDRIAGYMGPVNLRSPHAEACAELVKMGVLIHPMDSNQEPPMPILTQYDPAAFAPKVLERGLELVVEGLATAIEGATRKLEKKRLEWIRENLQTPLPELEDPGGDDDDDVDEDEEDDEIETHACAACKREFPSAKALNGHMGKCPKRERTKKPVRPTPQTAGTNP